MALSTLTNGENNGTLRSALNTMFAELYAALFNPTRTVVSGTSHTFALADVIGVDATGSAPTTFTIPLNATVAFPIGSEIPYDQLGTGALTIAGAVGVTIRMGAARSLTVSGQYEGGLVRKTDTDTWLVANN